MHISSVVQNRGSIPLFWSQETSRLNIKPDITLSKKDPKYQATRLHFQNLVKRYGNPIIILNLIKTREKKPRESILRAEFGNAIALINKDLTGESRLKFLHWDLNKYSKNKATDVLSLLGKVAAYALNFTGFFYCQVSPTSGTKGLINWSYFENNDNGDCSVQNHCGTKKDADIEIRDNPSGIDASGNHFVKPPMFQKGVLRTNCIDCLDRTNVAQYAFGLVALGHQLHALGFIDDQIIDLDSPLADDLMRLYERMGDTLALQYGGSAAHNKIFSQRRGQWKAATQSQEFFRTLQRYYSNAYMDAEKQDAINVFLGHFQPQQGKPALWELDSDQHYNIGRHGSNFADENARLSFKRSLSDGNILCESSSPIEVTDVRHNDRNQLLPDNVRDGNKGLSESTPEISTCESEFSYTRYTPSMSCKRLFPDVQLDQCPESDRISFDGRRDSVNCSNFLDMDWLSSSGNSCEEDAYERSTLISSPIAGVSSDSVLTGLKMESGTSPSELGSSMKNSDVLTEFSDSFVHWVAYGETLFP
ncbi:Phosphoinositide phosphatase [Actinidia chinensis var. chinensis]|uniref:Phosphoinositide phosphatase n=1 Tax=Actinidia chinensis var. chinensis TaxID=1590841 RepID=A0A2R6PV88_ACTCC|nr:Phosphoinositide phosphatase [Actinidia chinensis var. chinensis]